MRKRYRGKYTDSKLSAITISKLMGCHVSKAKRILYKIEELCGELSEELVGMAIQQIRNKEDLKRLK